MINHIDLGRIFFVLLNLHANFLLCIVKLGSRSKVYLKSLIRDLDLEVDSIIACLHHPENFSEQNNIEISSCMNWLVIWDPLGGGRRS